MRRAHSMWHSFAPCLVPTTTAFLILTLAACSRAVPPGSRSAPASSRASADLFVQPPTEMRVYGRPASAADGDSIGALMTRYVSAWRSGNAAAAAAAFAEDAEWTNAFGRVKRDRAELLAFLRDELFGGQTGTPGRPLAERMISFRYLGADAAILHTYGESEGQLSPRGTPMGYRRIHNTIVLARRPEGWRIVHQMIMDQRDTIP